MSYSLSDSCALHKQYGEAGRRQGGGREEARRRHGGGREEAGRQTSHLIS